MKENKYDDEKFFGQYRQMERSIKGLQGAGEWHELRQLLPDFENKTVLDLGCGFGWHCQYAAENGAKYVLGLDISEKMLLEARRRNHFSFVEYKQIPIEDFDYESETFDIVISSLAFHYLATFDSICKKVNRTLTSGGVFVFSVEHPVFTAKGDQDWFYDDQGCRLHWPVDKYFEEGEREAVFLGEKVIKYHRTLTTYIGNLLTNGFEIRAVVEPQPEKGLIQEYPEMKDELRRPMMLIISAVKKENVR